MFFLFLIINLWDLYHEIQVGVASNLVTTQHLKLPGQIVCLASKASETLSRLAASATHCDCYEHAHGFIAKCSRQQSCPLSL